jgi:hypothetical protein
MMKRIASALAVAALLLAVAPAQSQQFNSGYLQANAGASPAPARATAPSTWFDRWAGSTPGFVLYRGASAWLAAAPGATSGVQPYDAELAAIAGLTSANNKCFYWTGSGTAANFDCSSFGRGVSNAADAAALRVLGGLVIGSDVQAYDADLAAIAGLTSANNKCFYWTGSATAANYDCSSFGRSVANAADAAALRVLAGAVIGTNVQAWDADLDALAAFTSTGFAARTASNAWAQRTLQAPAAGFTITNPAGVAGDPTFVLANDLAALEALSSTGIARRTGTDAWSVGTLVSNAELATMVDQRIKGNVSGGTAAPSDLTSAQVTAFLTACVGDSGSGGTKGAVPAAGAGDAAAGKFLKADCTFDVPSASGGGGMTDTERQNSLLTLVYQSKLFVGYRRVVKLFADGYKASDGVNSGSSTGYTVTTGSGYVSPATVATAYGTVAPNAGGTGDRSASITVSASSGLIASGSAVNLVDGSLTENTSDSITLTGSRSVGSLPDFIRFDFGVGASKVINEAKWYRTDTANYGTWKWQGSNDASSWTDIGSSFTLGGATTQTDTAMSANTTGWRYYQILGVSGTTAAANWHREVEFKIADSPIGTQNMTLITTSQTTSSSVGNGRVLIEYDPNGSSPTLNTDITVDVTCDGGSHWAAATLSSVTVNSQGGRSVAETADTACTSGTSSAARLKTLNNKNVLFHGLTLTVH